MAMAMVFGDDGDGNGKKFLIQNAGDEVYNHAQRVSRCASSFHISPHGEWEHDAKQ